MASTLADNSSSAVPASGRKREQEIGLFASKPRYDCKRLQLPVCEAVDLIQVVDEVGWRGVWWEQDPNNPRRNEAAAYPVKRGTLVQLGPRDALLWIHGAVDGLGKRPHLQGGRGTPKPIRLVRHAGHGSWDDTAMAALALSKMNWNNDGLYDPLPVTMSYAKVLARVLKRMPKLGSTPFQFRFFM